MKSKNQKTLKVLPKTHEQLKFISAHSGLTITEFLSELVNEVFNIASSYPEKFNINYLPSISGSYVMVQCLGKNRLLVSGAFKVSSPEQVDEFEKNLVEKGTSFSHVAKQLSAKNYKPKEVTKVVID